MAASAAAKAVAERRERNATAAEAMEQYTFKMQSETH